MVTYTPVNKDVDPNLPVQERIPHILQLELLRLRHAHLVRPIRRLPALILQPVNDKRSLLLGQKGGRLGKVVEQEERRDRDEHGEDALEDEDPPPALKPADAVHLGDCKG